MAEPRKRLSKDRLDRLLLNPSLSRALLEDLGYSCDHAAAKEMGRGALGYGWIAYLPSPIAKRPEALLLPPNGRICKLEGDAVQTIGAIEVLRAHRSMSFLEAVRYLEDTYIGGNDVTPLEIAHNRRLPADRRTAAASVERTEKAQQPGLQPPISKEIDPAEALRIARERFSRARPDPGTGYLSTQRMISPQVVRRYGADVGRWAVIRYDSERDEAMFAHVDAEGRFVGYEFRGGITAANRRGSRGYAASCSIGLAIFGDLGSAERLVVCESGIECLSLSELEGSRSRNTVYISCSGGPKVGQMERVAAWTASHSGEIVLAYNADRPGDNFRTAARSRLLELGVAENRITEQRPSNGTDWNESLVCSKTLTIQRSPGSSTCPQGAGGGGPQ